MSKGKWVLYYETPDGRMINEKTFDSDPLEIIADGADGVLKDVNRDKAKEITYGKAKTKRKSKGTGGTTSGS